MSNVTGEELAKHNGVESCWVAIEGKVYDVTKFLADHPGGSKAILNVAGTDATKQFKMLHNDKVLPEYGPKFIVGNFVADQQPKAAAPSTPVKNAKPWPPQADVHPGSTQSWNSGGTANELPRERAKATFDPEGLTNVMDGGPEATKRRRWILAPLRTVDTHLKYDMDRNELISKHIEEFIAIHKAFIENGYIPTTGEVSWMSAHATNTGPLMPHMSLFLATIRGQATMEQQMWWLPRALTFQIIGSYAQTELGHGSNVRGLQTVAHYDSKTQEFVLNTPTLQSMKWWNSNIGVCATHATVFAQLILDGKEHGVHVFMVQVRDENHTLLPGVEAGDVGPKMGDHAIDTEKFIRRLGYMRLKNVRIPREHLLGKRQHVTSDGRYVKHKDAQGGEKLHYLTMMSARSGMIAISGGKLAIAATIAARYSCVRRQGFLEGGENESFKSGERQVIDYTVQLYRILKQITTAYAIKFTGMWMNTRFQVVSEAVSNGESVVPDDITEVHASSSGLKGLCTLLASDGIEDCRKACGGHGYLLNSGVAALAADYVWQTTAEGDFIVMLLQTARFLVKCVGQARAGQALPGLTAYMAPLKNAAFRAEPPVARTVAEFRTLPHLRSLFEKRALMDSVEAADAVASRVRAGRTQTDAFNDCSPVLVRAARSHCTFFLLEKYVATVASVSEPKLNASLVRLCTLYACSNIVDGGSWTGLLDRKQAKFCDQVIAQLLQELRPDVVALTDAFDIPDNVLNSTIGRHDGNVYEALYDGAVRSKLNIEQPFRGYVHLRPHLDLEFLALRNQPLPEVIDERKAQEEAKNAKARL